MLCQSCHHYLLAANRYRADQYKKPAAEIVLVCAIFQSVTGMHQNCVARIVLVTTVGILHQTTRETTYLKQIVSRIGLP